MKLRTPHDLFYWKDHQRHDAEFHEPILDNGDHSVAVAVSADVMKRLGFSDQEITALLEKAKPKQ